MPRKTTGYLVCQPRFEQETLQSCLHQSTWPNKTRTNQSINHPVSEVFCPFTYGLLIYGFIVRALFLIIPQIRNSFRPLDLPWLFLPSCDFLILHWTLFLLDYDHLEKHESFSVVSYLPVFIILKSYLYNLFPFILFAMPQSLLTTSLSSLFLGLYLEPRLRISGAIPLLPPRHFMTTTRTLSLPLYLLISLV
jgi:hypothetical protein